MGKLYKLTIILSLVALVLMLVGIIKHIEPVTETGIVIELFNIVLILIDEYF